MLTLKKVKEMVKAPVHTKRVPSPKVLLEDGQILLRKEFEHDSHLTLYHSGYVWFSAGKRNTVFHIHDCRGDYAYDAAAGKGEVIKEDYFENCEWHIRALFEGERRVEESQLKCEGVGQTKVCVSYHAVAEDWGEMTDSEMLKRLGVVIPSTILTLLMAVGFSTPAFAYVDTTEVTEEPVQVIEEAEPTEEEKIPFTIAGNGEVEDNMMDDPSKEFFTVKTKGGNTFFLVIDRARNSENVYMLSMIDEYDLQEFLDDEERNGQQEEETPAVVLPETKPEPTPDVEIEEPKEESSGGMNKILLLVFVAALGGAGAFFYFYIYKPKPKEETPQSENLETDQSLATVNEDNQSGNENDT